MMLRSYIVNMPVATTEMVSNLKAMRELGAISRKTVMEKSDLITDSVAELKRLEEENGASGEVEKDKERA